MPKKSAKRLDFWQVRNEKSKFLSHEETIPRPHENSNASGRLGVWAFARVGDIVNGCEKCQGLRKGETIIVMGQHRYIDLRWEPLSRMIDEPEYGKVQSFGDGGPGLW